jgi:prepilin signal peptidase PulO-like enzyme (type II secretory pathway)
VVASIAGAGTMFLIRSVGSRVLKKEAMGLGDVKLAAVIGLFTGFPGFVIALWTAAITGVVYSVWILRPAQPGLHLPFGSFLALTSSAVMMFYDVF